MHDDTIPSSTGEQLHGTPSRGEKTLSLLMSDALIVTKIQEFGFPSPTSFQREAIASIVEGRDVLVRGSQGLEATLIVGIPHLARQTTNLMLIVVENDAEREHHTEILEKLGLIAESASKSKDFSPKEGGFFVGTSSEVKKFITSYQGIIGTVVLSGTQADQLESSAIAELTTKGHVQLVALENGANQGDVMTKFFMGRQPSVIEPREGGSEGVTHYFFEVGGELMSKPQAVCDILEADGLPATLLFCGSPSDTDLVEVVLKRRGIGVQKLIGNVPHSKVVSALKQLKTRELACLIVTDVSARSIDAGEFELVISYSAPSDPEVYIHRTSTTSSTSSLKKAISLVGPLDRANFHYLKKIVEFDLKKMDTPSRSDLALARLKTIKAQANAKAYLDDETVKAYVEQILADPDKEKLLGMLVHSYLNAPQGGSSSSSRRGDDDHEGVHSRGGGQQGGPRQRGGRRGAPQGGGYDDSPSGEDDGSYSGRRGGNQRRGNDRRDSRGGNGGNGGNEGQNRRQPRQRVSGPPLKIARLYVGAGASEGYNEEKVISLLKEQGELSEDQIKRVSIRGHYSFVDLPDEAADVLLSKAADSLSASGICCKKAITLNVGREEEGSQLEDASSEEGGATGDYDSAGGEVSELSEA